jgi:4-amino-4-deoxy-L-arabinose transferase-like glycosyltransferase
MVQRGRATKGAWWPWIGLWFVVGLGIRIGTVIGRPNRVAGGDAYYYHNAANLLVSGLGFINPYDYFPHNLHHHIQTAAWPPLFVFVIAAASLVGFKSFLATRVWCCIIGAIAVIVCGYTGREIGGRRVGLLVAFLVAVYPNLWMSNELALSETLSPVLVALVLLAAYRLWRQPSVARAAVLGVTIALAALARDELSLLFIFILIPMVLFAKDQAWRKRILMLLAGGLAAAVLVGPWIGYNMSRFKDPVFISDGLGVTLASANCHDTYYGQYIGYWSFACAVATPINPHVDESVQGAEAQTYALHYIRTHKNRLVAVEAARLGRAFAFFSPIQQIQLDADVETRPYRWALVGLGMYYALFALSIGGAVVLRRRKVPIYPLLAIGLNVALSVMVTFGDTRYRSPFEITLVVLAAIQLDWFWSKLRRSPRGPSDLEESAVPEPSDAVQPSDAVLPTPAGL